MPRKTHILHELIDRHWLTECSNSIFVIKSVERRTFHLVIQSTCCIFIDYTNVLRGVWFLDLSYSQQKRKHNQTLRVATLSLACDQQSASVNNRSKSRLARFRQMDSIYTDFQDQNKTKPRHRITNIQFRAFYGWCEKITLTIYVTMMHYPNSGI